MSPQYAFNSAPANMPIMMASGGLPAAARQVQEQGRYGDSMLMHVSPGEVKGLQALAQSQGTSLTTNPNTGLPEAFKLKDILPTLLGVGASFLFPAAAPWMIGAGIGGIETLRTGDLGRGLMAGLGAFGGAGLGSSLVGAGGQAAMTGEVARQAAGTAGAAQMGTQAGADAILAAGARPETFMGNLQMAGQGVSALGQPGGFSNLATSLGQTFPSTTAKVAAATPAVMGVSETFSPKYDFPTTPEGTSNYAGPYYPTARDVLYPDEGRRSSREFTYFTPSNPVPGFAPFRAAQGGLVALAEGGEFLDDGSFVIDARTVAEIGNGSSNAGKEILAQIGGRPVEGPGDGVSDSVPAMIEGGQEARVARDEVIFDADTVREIGDGSVKRGAQKLYALMDQAHKARKQADRGEDTGVGLGALSAGMA
jgi:hypothetical protein